MTNDADPLELVRAAVRRSAAGEPVDLEAVRARLVTLAGLIHPGLRSDAPPSLYGFDQSDAMAPLCAVLDVLVRDGPAAAEAHLVAFYGPGPEVPL